MSAPHHQLLSQPHNHHNSDKLHLQDIANFPIKFQSNNDKSIFLNQNGDQDALDEEVIKKKNENKQRYRRLKQKLSSLCCENQEKCLFKSNKQVSSTNNNKARLLTLAIEFQKMTLNQTKDFLVLENKVREIHKILDLKLENDLVILKQSRFVPAFSTLLKKVPTFHKNQFFQSVKTIQLGFKVLRLFCTLSSNRDYMITTNQLSTLNSCLNSFIGKEQKRLAIECLNVLLQLLYTKIKADSQQIINVTLQIVFFGQLAKRLRQTIESCITQDGIQQEQYVIKCLKYLHILYRKCFEKYLERPLFQQSQIPQILQFHSDSLLSQLYQILPIMLLDKEQGCLKEEELPVCQINITMYILRLINICIHISLQSAQKNIEINEKHPFLQTIRHLFKYSKENVELSTGNHELSSIYSEIIDFIGKICCQSPENRKSIASTNLLEMLYNHPIVYIMDPKLKSILIPTLCSVMDQCEPNMKKYLSENSAQNIINYVLNQKKRYQEIKQVEGETLRQIDDFEEQLQQQQVGNPKKLNRKQSVSSFHSYTTQCTQNSYKSLAEEVRYATGLFFLVPYSNWESLIQKLRALDC